jgi:hypothetical protein
MDTGELILFVLRLLYSGVIVCGVGYSLYTGLRHGFRFPRLLHFMAVVIIFIEVGILVAFPVPLKAITWILGSLLILLPISPYIGWVLAGGPARLSGPETR